MNKAWLGAACALVACTKADFDAEVSTGAKVSEAHVMSARPVTVAPPGVLERRVLDLADCALEGPQITSMCPAMQTLSRELAQSPKTLSPAVAERLLAHSSPAVRIEAATLSANRTAVADAAHRERDPLVRQALVKLLAGDPRVASFATDPSIAVRREVVIALASHATAANTVALQHVIETDAEASVRADACRRAGISDSLLPLFERTTDVRSTDPELRDACMEGLSAMVLESEGAYRLFLRRVVEGVRPWQAMSAFCPYKASKRPAWFSVDEVRTVLASVIDDPATPPMAAAAARESLDTLTR
ncbi:MAG: HEAT repeat domain-containing protein [Kofleriaceae bacterium]